MPASDEGASVLDDAEVKERLAEPGMMIELERMALPRLLFGVDGRLAHPLRTDRPNVVIENPDGTKVTKQVDNELYSHKRLLFGEDPMQHFWNKNDDLIQKYQQSTAAKSFPFLESYDDRRHAETVSNSLMHRENASTGIVAAVDGEWKNNISRYGELNKLQNEERRILDKMYNVLSHYQEAIVSRDMVRRIDITDFLLSLDVALRDLICIDYCVREKVANVDI